MALHYLADLALDDLLTAWRHYDDVRRAERTSCGDLGRARTQLDDARNRMHRIRMATHPSSDEYKSAIQIALCPSLDQVVYLGWNHLEPGGRTHVRCVCGDLLPLTAENSVVGQHH